MIPFQSTWYNAKIASILNILTAADTDVICGITLLSRVTVSATMEHGRRSRDEQIRENVG